jgi:hypothetical protein
MNIVLVDDHALVRAAPIRPPGRRAGRRRRAFVRGRRPGE